MPHLKLAGHRFSFASDDFVIPGIIEASLRGFWAFCVAFAVFGMNRALSTCISNLDFQTWTLALLGINAAVFVLSCVLVYFSGRGVPLNPKPRQPVKGLFVVLLLTTVGEVGVVAFLTQLRFTVSVHCAADSSNGSFALGLLTFVIIVEWLHFLGVVIALAATSDCLSARKRRRAQRSLQGRRRDTFAEEELGAELWTSRCRLMCACTSGSGVSLLAPLARDLSVFLLHTDAVPSDILLGMVLVRSHQKHCEATGVSYLIPAIQRALRYSPPSAAAADGDGENAAAATIADGDGGGGGGNEDDTDAAAAVADTGEAKDGNDGDSDGDGDGDGGGASAIVAGSVSATASAGAGDSDGEMKFPTPSPAVHSGDGCLNGDDVTGTTSLLSSTGILPPTTTPVGRGKGRQLDAVLGTALRELHEFMPYALGVYGWPLYVFAHPGCGVCTLLGSGCCCCCASTGGAQVQGDNCNGNSAAMAAELSVAGGSMVYGSWVNSVEVNPYAICVDHARSTVVVTLRGTLSFADALTDALCTPEPLDELGEEFGFDGAGHSVHGAILRSAAAIRRHLVDSGILATQMELTTDSGEPYSLLITGHSLGAGLAAALSLLLRPLYPALRCFAYSPPGGLFSRQLSRLSEQWTTSLVLGRDLIPRLSVWTLHRLRDQMVFLTSRCKLSKANVLSKGIRHNLSPSELMFSEEEVAAGVADDVSIATADAFFARTAKYIATRGEVQKMYPPGRIALLAQGKKVSKCCGCCGDYVYEPRWVPAEALLVLEVHTRMVQDHMPDRVYSKLGDIVGPTSAGVV